MGYRSSLSLAWDGVRYKKPLIAIGMTSTSIFFLKKSSIYNFLILSRLIIDS